MSVIPQLSFVVPVKDEKKSIDILCAEIVSICKKIDKSYELIFIDDGSIDDSWQIIKSLHKKNPRIVGIRHRRNFGKSIALQNGFNRASAKLIFTLDGDLQDDPSQIPIFLKKIEEGYDLVSGWKKKRSDPLFSKVVPSRIINFLTRIFTGLNIHDTNCGFKLYKKDVLESINLYGELYRYLPVLVHQKGFRIGEVIVKHRSRRFGKSKFGWIRGIRGILDLLTVAFLTGYSTRPGHFFGTIGIGFSFAGFIIGIYLIYLRLTTGGIDYHYPLLIGGVLLIMTGVQFISLGLLGEMILTSQSPKLPKGIILEEL
jgi:glycosyltransferase involved in cell wall biosynthesis